MRLLRLAVETRKWDLAAHAIVLGTASALRDARRTDAGKTETKTIGRAKGNPKR